MRLETQTPNKRNSELLFVYSILQNAIDPTRQHKRNGEEKKNYLILAFHQTHKIQTHEEKFTNKNIH